MKKIFGMRKHRNRDRELDERYEEEILDYDEDYPEDEDDYLEDDEDYRMGKERYRDDEDDYYRDDDEDYSEDDEDYREVDEDYRDDDEDDYREVDEGNRDDDNDYPEDDEDYREVDEDYRDDEDDNSEDEVGHHESGEEDSQDKDHGSEAGEFYEEDEYPEDEAIYGKESHVDDEKRGTIVAFSARIGNDEDYRDGEEDYPENDEDYREDNDYPEEDDDYPEEDDDYPEDDEDYREDDDYPEEDDDYPEEDDDYPEDEDDYPEDDDDYPEDDRNYRDDRRDGVGARILSFIANTSAVERIAVGFALLIVIGGIVTASFYSTAKKGNQQLESFTEIGTDIQGIDVIGQSGLLAIADAEKARALAADLITDNMHENFEEEEEVIVADDAEDVTIQMTVTSIKSDLKVKFINSKTGKLVANLPLEIDVVNPDGTNVTYNDHDQDGIIYKKDLTAGEYKVTPKALGAGFENYKLELSSKSVTVKDTVEMKAVDVSNEIKKESQVNAAQEDTAVKEKVESTLTDTVEYVDSNKIPVGESNDGNYTFEIINKDTIQDPTSYSMLGFGKYRMLLTDIAENPNTSEAGSGDQSEVPGEGNSQKNEETETPSESPSEGESKEKTEPAEKEDMPTTTKQYNVTVGNDVKIQISGLENPRYESADTGIATVSSDGTVKGVAAGTVIITIHADNYKDGSVFVTVEEKKEAPKEINLPDSFEVKVAETKKLSESLPSTISFEYDNTKIIITKDGSITGFIPGQTDVIAIDGSSRKTIKVNVAKGDIKLAQTSYTLIVKESKKIEVNSPSGCSFKSNNEEKVTVKDGVITGVSVGETTITISAENYNSVEVPVTVVANASSEVPMSYTKLTLVKGRAFEVKSKDTALAIKLKSDNNDVASVSGNVITANSEGYAKIAVSADGYNPATIEVTVVGSGNVLKDKQGNVVYVKKDGKYVEATLEDYYNYSEFFLRKGATTYKYTGWQTIDNKTYFFKKDGNYVTGEQVIKGVKYVFNSEGVLQSSTGIDVSKWNGKIDWSAVKNSGVSFVIIRCGYRGSSQGALIEDPQFRSNINGALNAGIRVGVYFFTQAVNEVEAVEEASMVINLVKSYSLSMPVYLDVESSGGRGDKISPAQRTANIKAFCGTIANAGYTAGVYANKTWFSQMINVSQITNYKIWLAQYAASVTYSASRYDMWQCTSKGAIPGITGNVDMNICY